jgi:membrane-associated phospholipid phosphatase
MKPLRLAAILLASVAACVSPARAQPPPDDAISPWIHVALDEIAAHRVDPPHASRVLATVSVAMEQAVARSDPAASADAAVDGAASTVLAYFFPEDTGRFHGLAERADHASARSSGRGFALGRRTGEELIARARNDGAETPFTGNMPVGPEYWVPTPPSFLPPLLPGWGKVRTWNIGDPVRLRPPPPPRPGNPVFESELREVYAISQTLTPEQREIALFWADGPGTLTPPGHWNAIALELVHGHALDTTAAARVLAALNTAEADAFICTWDAKYTYWSLRPVTAIRPTIDPDWSPLIPTPPFPSYVSGHSAASGAASTVLSAFFPAEASQLHAWAAEAALSRLYAGIHFRSDNEAGLALGTAVGKAALDVWGR